MPGQSLVVLDPELRLVVDVIPCEDGHAQERSLSDAILASVRPAILDRGPQLLHDSVALRDPGREAFFVIRQHARNLHWELVGKRRDRGRIETGRVFEQTIRTTNDAGEILFLRRMTVVLDKPTRDGDTEIHVLTNLPGKDARAAVIADCTAGAGPSRPPSKNWRRRSKRDQHLGPSQGGIVCILRRLGRVQHHEHGQSGAAFGPWRDGG